VETLRGLREKVGGIERQYGNEVVIKLNALRDEVAMKVDGSK
jgi:hypothetical protein